MGKERKKGILSQHKDPYLPASTMESKRFFFRGSYVLNEGLGFDPLSPKNTLILVATATGTGRPKT